MVGCMSKFAITNLICTAIESMRLHGKEQVMHRDWQLVVQYVASMMQLSVL